MPFARRVELFRALLEEDKCHGGYSRTVHEGGVPPVKVRATYEDSIYLPNIAYLLRLFSFLGWPQLMVKRANLMEDSFRGLSHLGSALKARLSITFVNEQGLRCEQL